MGFASPIWLLALLPWAAVTLWLLWGKRKRSPVPFLPLWEISSEHPHRVWALEPPPVALVLAILAMLLAVFSASRPVLHGFPGTGQRYVTVIVDRGLTMSAAAGAAEYPTRFMQVAEQAAGSMRVSFGNPNVRLIAVPETAGRPFSGDAWLDEVRRLPVTAIDTRDALKSIVARTLADETGPVIVLTDHELPAADARLIVAPPASPLRNVAIISIAARPNPVGGQVMIRLLNHSDRKQATLILQNDGDILRREIPLPADGLTGDFFFDLPRLGKVIEARIRANDDPAENHAAFLVRQGSWPRLEARGTFPPELRRLMDGYAQLQPPGADSIPVVIANSNSNIAPSEPAVIAPSGSDLTRTPLAGGGISLKSHPVTTGITGWEKLTADPSSTVAALPDSVGWQPIVSVQSQPLIAVRENPARQVWIGFDSQAWPRSVAYVELWKNAFDWVGQGDNSYVSSITSRLGPGWTRRAAPSPAGNSLAGDAPFQDTTPGFLPGIYQRPDGALRAINAPEIRFAELSPTPNPSELPAPWQRNMEQWRNSSDFALPFGPWLLLASIACVLFAALTWRRRKRAPAINPAMSR